MNLKSPLVIIKCPLHLSIRRALLSGVSAASLLCAGPALAAEVIDGGAIVTVPGDHPSPWNYSDGLTVGKNGSGTLNIVNGGVVSGDGATIGDGSTGTVTVDGAGSTWTTNGVVYIGNTGAGTLIISNGGKYNSLNTDSSVYFEIGEQATGNGTIVVSGVDSNTGDRSELITNNRMYIGAAGTGRLDVLDGGLVSAEYSSSVGELSGSKGVLNVSGVDTATDQRSTFRVTHNQFWVGNEGEGIVNITNGGLVQVEQTVGIGAEVGSIGGVTVSGVDQASGYHSSMESGQVRVGYGAFGTLAISDGGHVSDVDGSVGYLAGSKGVAVVEGVGSEWINVGEFTVGYAGVGELLIKDGGKVSSALGYIGRNAGSTGTVTVEGAGSEWKNVNTLSIGDDGRGELLIRDGGKVSSASGQIGHGTDSNGAVNVEGSDSIWTITNRLNLGELGTGTLNIRNGGQVSAYLGEVGIRGGTGNVLVEGAGSALTIAQYFGIGAGGIGALIIRDGGAVYDDVGTVGFSSSSTHSVAIVDGPGSTWKSTNFQSVGGSSNGTLTVSNGGTVIAPVVYLNLTSEINIGAAAGHAAVAPGSIVADKLSLSYDNNAHLVFNHTDMSGNYAFAPTITGGNANSAVDVYSGNTVLTGVGSDYFMATNIHGGILSAGGDGIFSANSNFTVDTAGTLDLRGYDQTIASLANAGNVNFGGKGGAVLTVADNYTGNGGMVTINTVLGDDNSKTDLLHVNGDTSGSSKLYVNNVGGKGALTDNGIKVVEVDGQSSGGFALGNGYTTKDGKQAVVGGAYAYTLQQGGANTPNDGDWYLTSQMMPCDETDSCSSPVTPATRYSASVPVYEGYLQNMQALNKLPTLQQRVGERYWTGRNGDGETNGAAVNDKGVWARIEGAHNRLEPDTSLTRMKQDVNTFIMQAGVDGQFYEDETGKLIAGITGQYGHARGDISSFHGDGDISTDAWSLGATATWYGNSGFYVDGQAQVTWFDSDLNSSTANQGLADGRKATGYAMSIEAGQRFAINQNWSLTPQAQLMYSSINANAFHDTWGSRVSLHDGDSLIGRIGLAANYANSWKGEDGLMVNTNIYGIANLYQEMLGGSSVNVSGVEFDTDNDKTWGGIGAGGTYAWADNKYALYGEGSINTALNHFSDSYALKGTLGFKVKW
jgi:outer membrane autotransporter protein